MAACLLFKRAVCWMLGEELAGEICNGAFGSSSLLIPGLGKGMLGGVVRGGLKPPNQANQASIECRIHRGSL